LIAKTWRQFTIGPSNLKDTEVEQVWLARSAVKISMITRITRL